MSTNYYLSTPDKAVRDKYLKDYTLTDEPSWGYEIHIAKVSCGWVPLFQAHDGAFNSYAELRKIVEKLYRACSSACGGVAALCSGALDRA